MDEQSLNGLEVADNETVCPSCHLVYLTTAGKSGVCFDCHTEGIRALPV